MMKVVSLCKKMKRQGKKDRMWQWWWLFGIKIRMDAVKLMNVILVIAGCGDR